MPDTSSIDDNAPQSCRGEWRFLIQCVAKQLAGDSDAMPLMPDGHGLNWTTILRLAEAHRVVPLLSALVLAGKAKDVPPEIAVELRNRFQYYAKKGMSFAMELREVLGALRKAGIRCIPLKGPVLTAGSYRKMGLRDFDDLDLLVAPADVTRTVDVLAKLGYAGWDIPQRWLATQLSTESEHQLICQERNVTLDLHWAVGRKYFTIPSDFEKLWARTTRTKLIGSDVPDLSSEDMILFLCYHGGKHLFSRLTWVCDIAAAIGAHPNLDWDVLLARAKQMGARRLLLLGLGLAQGLLQTILPIRVQQLIRDESALQPLTDMVLRGIFRETDSISKMKLQVETCRFHVRSRERTFDKLRYLVWAAQPNARDWLDSRLPPSLSFLLVLTRPIRLIQKNLNASSAKAA